VSFGALTFSNDRSSIARGLTRLLLSPMVFLLINAITGSENHHARRRTREKANLTQDYPKEESDCKAW